MGEIHTAHRTGRHHGQAFGQLDTGVLGAFEQIEEQPFLGVVGTGRITGSRTDAAVFLADEIFVGQ